MSGEYNAASSGPVLLHLNVPVEAMVHQIEGGLRAEVPSLPNLVVEGADLHAVEVKLAGALTSFLAGHANVSSSEETRAEHSELLDAIEDSLAARRAERITPR